MKKVLLMFCLIGVLLVGCSPVIEELEARGYTDILQITHDSTEEILDCKFTSAQGDLYFANNNGELVVLRVWTDAEEKYQMESCSSACNLHAYAYEVEQQVQSEEALEE